MAAEQPWSVHAASRIVAVIEGVAGVVMGTMQALGQREADKPKPVPLAGFRRASKVTGKGARWSIAGVVGLGALVMVAALLFAPRAKPAPARAAADVLDRDTIARRCRAGAYRDFPEIEQAECVDRPGPPSTPRGDVK